MFITIYHYATPRAGPRRSAPPSAAVLGAGTHGMVPYEVRQCVVPVELVVEERPVGGGLEALTATPQHYGPLARRVASLRRRPAQPRRPVLQGELSVVLRETSLI